MRTRPPDASARLTAWIKRAYASTVLEVERFAVGIQKDAAAVLGASTSPWSNGQVEGQVTRVKLLKRQMCGRAKFDLLRARILLALRAEPDRVHGSYGRASTRRIKSELVAGWRKNTQSESTA